MGLLVLVQLNWGERGLLQTQLGCVRSACCGQDLGEVQVICLPRGVDPGLWVPQQSQAVEAPSKMWAATRACLQFGGSCDSSVQDCSGLLSSTSGSHTDYSTS